MLNTQVDEVDPHLAARPVLVVDDDDAIRRLVRAGLEREGFVVRDAPDATSALDELEHHPPALVVLDVNLDGVGGFDVLSRIRARGAVPVIMLTGRDTEVDRVLGLELGADDYVVKPFSPRELASRVRAVLRRSVASQARTLDFGELCVDLDGRRVAGGAPVDLTAKEFDLLAFLAAQPGHVFSRAELLAGVWRSTDDWQDPATVTEHVRRLRVKIEPEIEHPRWIRTVRARGYSFEP